MSSYVPIGGQAGKITVRMFRRANNTQLGNTLQLSVFGFKESLEDAQDNDMFENILGTLTENYYGERKVISFSVANGSSLDAQNLHNIFVLCGYINFIRNQPRIFRLEIEFRKGIRTASVINDAVFFGDRSPQEITDSANAGQTIPMQFKSRTYSNNIQIAFDHIDGITEEVVSGEETNTIIVLESGGKILLEGIPMHVNEEGA